MALASRELERRNMKAYSEAINHLSPKSKINLHGGEGDVQVEMSRNGFAFYMRMENSTKTITHHYPAVMT